MTSVGVVTPVGDVSTLQVAKPGLSSSPCGGTIFGSLQIFAFLSTQIFSLPLKVKKSAELDHLKSLSTLLQIFLFSFPSFI
jgi:hypothetical protein